MAAIDIVLNILIVVMIIKAVVIIFYMGRYVVIQQLKKSINKSVNALHPEDATGHIYWNQFLELVKNFKP